MVTTTEQTAPYSGRTAWARIPAGPGSAFAPARAGTIRAASATKEEGLAAFAADVMKETLDRSSLETLIASAYGDIVARLKAAGAA